jgi:23S rRNA pseudouridine1911/1915/1917 synthase
MDLTSLDSHIIFEDDSLIVLNKPAGIVVNRSRTQNEPTIQDWMIHKFSIFNSQFSINADRKPGDYGTPEEIFAERSGIVHRLDKDTSGVLLLAKTSSALSELMRQFRERETEKTYLALVHGKLSPSEGIIMLPTDRSSVDRSKFTVVASGRMSETHYKLIEHFPGLPKGMHPKKGKSYQGFSLVELSPKTGRTHQIRVHMSAINHPLVGDAVYAGKKRVELDSEWCPRQFLHAKRLCFTHPTSKERVCFEAPLPQDLEKVVTLIQSS